MNPAYFAAVPLIETMQTMVHEMCHLWQHHFGTPGRGRYHNEEWAARMEAVGLMPSSTGQPGGKRTGDMMADYALSGGRFLEACSELLTSSFQLSWYDRFPAEDHVRLGQQAAAAAHLSGLVGSRPPMETAPALAGVVRPVRSAAGSAADQDGAPPVNKSNRLKYTCSQCRVSVWGKPGLKIICGECQSGFIAQKMEHRWSTVLVAQPVVTEQNQMTAVQCGFNRSMQHTKFAMAEGVLYAEETKDLLHGSPEGCDVGALESW